jgi:hypothetical protein
VNVVPAGPDVGLKVMGGSPDAAAALLTPARAAVLIITKAARSTTSLRFFMTGSP